MVSQMWLPFDVCQAFENAFNLTWNATTELYTLTKNQHTSLLAQNPTFTFTIGSLAYGGGESTKIVLPYAAFDLSVTQPAVDSATNYFPLKRAANSSQITLGRVFLQEAYVVTDYDRRNFSVSQAAVPSRDTASNIVAIEAPGEVLNGQTTASALLNTGALAGIIVGGVVALVLVIAAFLLVRRLVFGSDRKRDPVYNPYKRSSSRRFSGRPSGPRYPLEINAMDSGIFESDGRPKYPPELDADGDGPKYPSQVYELRDRRSVVELEAPFDRFRRSGGVPF